MYQRLSTSRDAIFADMFIPISGRHPAEELDIARLIFPCGVTRFDQLKLEDVVVTGQIYGIDIVGQAGVVEIGRLIG